MILKGFIIGIGKILPGVSGALLAFSLGVYEKSIFILSNLRKELLNNLKFIFSLCFGISLAIILGSRVINYLFINYKIPTMYLFIGLIIGTIPNVLKKISFNLKHFIICIISFTCLLSLSFIKTDLNLESYFILGLIEAISIIIPGVSGTAIMLILGNYDDMLSLMMNPFQYKITIFLMGLFIGILFLAKIMNFLLKKHVNVTYFVIVGFLLGSIFNLYISIMDIKISILTGIFSMFLLLLGIFISKNLNKNEKKISLH